MSQKSVDSFAISGRLQLIPGNGGSTKAVATSNVSMAEIYLHGAHVTHFQKNGEPPLLFLSRKSSFGPGQPIRGGIPICFPWFGPRNGEPAHGLARILEWEIAGTSAGADGSVQLRLRLPQTSLKAEWSTLQTELVITVADTLMMELIATNESADKALEIENCLHTYFYIGDINAISISGLEKVPFDDFAAGAGGTRKPAENAALRITKETNRVYFDSTQSIEIRDKKLRRTIRIEKSGSRSTVVWNPWTTQKLPDDFDPLEYQTMVCVESGSVKQNKIALAPGKTAVMKVVLSSESLK